MISCSPFQKNSASHSPPSYSRFGFTIIELLVAAAITVVLAGLMLALVGNVLNGWNQSHGALTAEAQARLVLDRLSQDLQGAFYRDDGGVWLAATVESSLDGGGKPAAGSLDLATPALADARYGAGGVWLRFFTTQLGGSPAAAEGVGYKIVYRGVSASAAAEKHYQLCRAEVLPADTLAAGYAIDGTGYSLLGAPGYPQLIADNVIDFGVRFYVRDATTGVLTLVFPANASGQPDNGDLEHLVKSPPSSGNLSDRFPDVADVMLRVLTDEGARQIQALENNQISGDWWAIATAHSKVFTRRVVLHASPL